MLGRIAITLTAGAALTLGVTACSSTPSSEFASTTAPGSASATSTHPAPPPDIASITLSVSDMPTGWTTSTDKTAISLGEAGCLKSASRRTGAKASRYVTFAGAGGSPVFSESLADLGAPQAPAAFIDAVKTLDDCHAIKITAGKVTFSGPLQATSFPTIGNQSRAYTLSAKSGSHVLTEYIVIAQQNGLVMMTSYGSVKNGNIADFLSLTSRAANKLTP